MRFDNELNSAIEKKVLCLIEIASHDKPTIKMPTNKINNNECREFSVRVHLKVDYRRMLEEIKIKTNDVQ